MTDRRKDKLRWAQFKQMAKLAFHVLVIGLFVLVFRLNTTVDRVDTLVSTATGENATKAQQAIVIVLLKEDCRTQIMLRDIEIKAIDAESAASECATKRFAEFLTQQAKLAKK